MPSWLTFPSLIDICDGLLPKEIASSLNGVKSNPYFKVSILNGEP